jgi:hypothetical protein
MSSNITATSQRGDNKAEKDELEEEFLKCKIEDLPIPKKELENFQFEVREVMKSGCNLQIAEYALMKYDIQKNLSQIKEEYDQYKQNIMKLTSDDIVVYFNNLKENIIKAEYEDDDGKDTKNKYEEEADEIMEKRYNDIDEINDSNNKNINLNLVKEDLMNMFKKNVNNSINENEFKEAKRKYIEKREAIIETALRIVKKIVNDEGEYKKFKEKYLDKLKEQK